MNLHAKKVLHELHQYLRQQANWKTILRWLLIGIVAFCLVVWFGKDVVEEIQLIEEWIAGHGVLGWFVFILLIIVCNSMFVPLSFLALAGGAIFGVWGGTILVFTSAVLTAAIDYLLASSLLRPKIEQMLERHPKLQAIQTAFQNEGMRLQVLLRMAPVSAASVSYVLGATGSKFSTFLVATIGLLPSVIANVYFGYSASHVTKAAGGSEGTSALQTTATVVGAIICIVVMIMITRVATRAITQAQTQIEQEESDHPPSAS